MTFDLINLNSFVYGVIVLLALGALAEFFTSNRKVRLERHATIPVYYGNLLNAH